MNKLGFEAVAQHLDRVQKCQDDFAHGDPHAIDNAIVTAIVENLKREHESWISVFNQRGVRV